jgi:hypothetical protein
MKGKTTYYGSGNIWNQHWGKSTRNSPLVWELDEGLYITTYKKCYEMLHRALKLVGSLQHGNEGWGSTKCGKFL